MTHSTISCQFAGTNNPAADIGVLSTYATSTTPLTLTRSGLTHLTTAHLDKILEAAFYKSRQQLAGEEAIPEDAICVTGLDMWEDDGSKEGQGGEVVYWRGCPEFGHLADYKPRALSTDNTDGKALTLKEKIAALLASASSPTTTVNGGDAMRVDELVTAAFLAFLSSTLGFPPETFDTGAGLAMYGLDSLNAVAVQYWCFRGTFFSFRFLLNLLSEVLMVPYTSLSISLSLFAAILPPMITSFSSL